MAETENKEPAYLGWAVLELFGHRRLGGVVREVSQYGGLMCRIDIPGEGADQATQFYGASAIFSLTPCDEASARAVAKHNRIQPVTYWEMPRPQLPTGNGSAPMDDAELEDEG